MGSGYAATTFSVLLIFISCIMIKILLFITLIWTDCFSSHSKMENPYKNKMNITFDEMVFLLSYFGYEFKQGGTGSGVKFIKEDSNEVINFHKPHPSGVLKRYVLDQVIEKLKKLLEIWLDKIIDLWKIYEVRQCQENIKVF